MGYFSNGSEGMDYEEQYCAACIHHGNCAIWDAHQLRNYEECNNEKSILHMLIPRSADGLSNEECRMFRVGRKYVERDVLVEVKAMVEEFPVPSDQDVYELQDVVDRERAKEVIERKAKALKYVRRVLRGK